MHYVTFVSPLCHCISSVLLGPEPSTGDLNYENSGSRLFKQMADAMRCLQV